MPNQATIDDTKAQFRDYIGQSNATIEGEIDGKMDETGEPVEGFAVSRGEQTYQLLFSPGLEWVDLRVQVSLPHNLAAQKAAVENGGALPGSLDESQVRLATQSLEQHLQDLDDDRKRDTRAAFVEVVSRDGLTAEVEGPHALHIHGFTSTAHLYPYHQEVGFAEFHDTVQRIVNAAWSGNQLLMFRYGLDGFVDGGGGPTTSGGPRAFQ